MAQARRRSRRETGASQGLPGWAMLTIGLVVGLFVAFLVYLDEMEKPPNAAVDSSPNEQASTTGESSAGDTAQAPAGKQDGGERGGEAADGKSGKKDPRFEFYSILPELEVVVPEHKQDDPADSASESDGREAPPSGQGPYYLQAGSFQQAEQADRMKARIALLGLDVAIQRVRIDGEQWHRVRVGPYSAPDKLRNARERLRAEDIDFLVLRKKDNE